MALPMGEHGYDMIKNGDQGIGGIVKAAEGQRHGCLSHMSVSDADASYQSGKYYVLKTADGKGRAGLMKAPHPEAPSMWMPYVRVAKLGGELMMAPEDIPGVGRICAFFDSMGAAIAIIKPAPM